MANRELRKTASEYFTESSSLHAHGSYDIKILSGGLVNCTFKVNNTESDRGPIVLSIYRNDQWLRVEQQKRVSTETERIPNIPMQRLLSTSITQSGIGIAEREFIKGDTIAHFIENGNLPEAGLSTIMQELGYILANIHSVPAKLIGRVADQNNNTTSWRDFFMHRFGRRVANIMEIRPDIKIGGIKIQQVQDMMPRVVEVSNEISPLLSDVGRPFLLHHDFHFLNIIMTDKPLRVQGVLDWENLTGGDPEFDLAFLETQLYLNRKFLPKLEHIKKHLVEGYANKSGYWPQTPKRPLYMLDCALSYFEAVSKLSSDKTTDQIKLYAKGHAENIKELCHL